MSNRAIAFPRFRRRILPGFGLSLGFTLAYLGLIVLVPLLAAFIRTSGMTWAAFVSAVAEPRVIASYKLSFGISFLAAGVNAFFGLIVAWVLVRYPFPGRKVVDALVDLPGVGRKTANVVLGHALGVPGLPVDRHVLRVANRIGLVHSDDPVAVETALCSVLPKDRWTRASDDLILHGRRVCRPKPLCDRCQVRAYCAYYKNLGVKAPRRAPAR